MQMPRKYGRSLSRLAWPLGGFLGVFFFWSITGGTASRSTIRDQVKEVKQYIQKDPVWQSWNNIKHVFVFGDSYSSTGFDPSSNEVTLGTSLGEWNHSSPNPVVAKLAWLNYLEASQVKTYNFAQDGAFVDRHAYKAQPLLQSGGLVTECVTFKEQAGCWTHAHAPQIWHDSYRGYKKEWAAKDTLATIWFGMPDVHAAAERDTAFATEAIFASYSASFERVSELSS